MMIAALVIGIVCGFLAVGLNLSVHFLRTFIVKLDLGWWTIIFPAVGAGMAVLLVRYLVIN